MKSPLEYEDRACGCGCGLTFRTSHRSSKFYLNRRHQKQAKDLRKSGQPTQPQRRFVASAETLGEVGQLLPPGFSPEVVLALIATTPDVQHPSGSAVLISPHCALTAKHVIEEYFDLRASPDAPLTITGRSGLVDDHQNIDWRFDQVVRDPNSDMALLVLSGEEPPITGLRYPTIHIPPPATGDEIVAVGFPSSTIEPSVDGGETVSHWNDLPTISNGRVFEVHHQKRDLLLANFPCFIADCKVDGGMSGGPVFDRNGFLRGIISRGISLNDDRSHTTTIQSIWTSLILPTNDSSLIIKGYGKSLYEAAQQGKIQVTGMERLEPRFREDGTVESLSLRAAPVAPNRDQELIRLSEVWKNASTALNESLLQQHGTDEDGTPKFQFVFVESAEINANAADYGGVAVITVNTALRDLVWSMCADLSRDPKIAARFNARTEAQQQALHVELFNTTNNIVVGHEYGHHVLDHCVQRSPNDPLHSDITSSYGGSIEHQAREIHADGYAVYLALYALLIGARRDAVAQSIPGITDEGRLSLFIIGAATFFFLREPVAGFDAARIEELTHPPAAFRLNALMHHVQRYLNESKPELLPVLTLPLFQELLRNVKEVLWEGEGPAWPAQNQFGLSPAGDAYVKKLHAAYDALQEANQVKRSAGSQS